MRSALLSSFFLTAVTLTATLTFFGQEIKDTKEPGRMLAGESLVYDGKISKLKFSVSIAELVFAATAQPDSSNLVVKTQAASKGTLIKLFRYSFLQQYESTVDLKEFRVSKTTKHDVQKQRVRDSEAVFDYAEKRVRYVETDPKDANRPPRRIASEISTPTYDLISAIYSMRLEPLTVGKKFELSISDSGLVYKVPIVVTAREQQKTMLGKVWCYRVEPQIFGPGRLIEQKGKMVIWMVDDARRTPVLAKINTTYGEVEIKLKSVVSPT